MVTEYAYKSEKKINFKQVYRLIGCLILIFFVRLLEK